MAVRRCGSCEYSGGQGPAEIWSPRSSGPVFGFFPLELPPLASATTSMIAATTTTAAPVPIWMSRFRRAAASRSSRSRASRSSRSLFFSSARLAIGGDPRSWPASRRPRQRSARAAAGRVLGAAFSGTRHLEVGLVRGLLLEDVLPVAVVVHVEPGPLEDEALVHGGPRVEEHVIDLQLRAVLHQVLIGRGEETGHALVRRLEIAGVGGLPLRGRQPQLSHP